jgi:Na+-translocating ferredoxin:NAD+ oxidoreductase RNF subunit RnfB
VAFYHGVTSVGTVPTPVDGTLLGFHGGNPYKMHIKNNDNTTECYIGGSDVTTSTGYLLSKLEALDLVISPTDILYCVSTKNGHNISWLTEPV